MSIGNNSGPAAGAPTGGLNGPTRLTVPGVGGRSVKTASPEGAVARPLVIVVALLGLLGSASAAGSAWLGSAGGASWAVTNGTRVPSKTSKMPAQHGRICQHLVPGNGTACMGQKSVTSGAYADTSSMHEVQWQCNMHSSYMNTHACLPYITLDYL